MMAQDDLVGGMRLTLPRGQSNIEGLESNRGSKNEGVIVGGIYRLE